MTSSGQSGAAGPRGVKRKADEPAQRSEKDSKSSGPSSTKPAAAGAPSKPPPKGSFAELMAKAREVQQKAPKVGVLKHQPATQKPKMSLAEKKKRAMEAAAKEKEAARGKKNGTSATAESKPGSKPSEGTVDKKVLEYKGTARPAQSTYRGTANLPSRRGSAPDRRRPPRRDEYLATDEEDEGDYYYDDYDDDYYSDASSVMEAGIEDLDREEELALKIAKQEDEEDIRREMEAKRQKMERRKKLATLAAKSK